jgi:hypothetical protein
VLCADATLADLNRLAIHKSDRTDRDFDPARGQNLRRFRGVNAGDYGTHFCHHARKVDPDFASPDTAASCVALIVREPADTDQRLGGYAAGPGAITTQLLGRNEHFGADLSREAGGGQAGRPATDHDQVVTIGSRDATHDLIIR